MSRSVLFAKDLESPVAFGAIERPTSLLLAVAAYKCTTNVEGPVFDPPLW